MLLFRKNIFYFICILFIVIFFITIGQYINYINAIIHFSYDWEPTDGDHLNFAHRLARGLPIYMPMSSGKVLSIYNPLYHAIVAISGGQNSSLNFARIISFIFWLAIPVSAFFYFQKKHNVFYGIIVALFIWLPPEPTMLIEVVQVSPNSTMPFFFFCTLLYAEKCSKQNIVNWWSWFLLGTLISLTYLSKQQGIIVTPIVFIFLLIRRIKILNLFFVIISVFFVLGISTLYLEGTNSGQFLRMTLLDLPKILHSSYRLAFHRLLLFLFHNFAFTICVFFSIITFYKSLSIWQISLICHIPFLLKILGNAGGGITYCLSLWISMVIISLDYINSKKALHFPIKFEKTSILNYIRLLNYNKIILFLLCVNISIGTISINRDFNSIYLPTPKLNSLMNNYYRSIDSLITNKDNIKILTNRNVGMLVQSNVNVENEGSSLFQYAWFSDFYFNRDLILTSIREKRYDFITTGIQDYPADVKLEINKYYKIILINEINLLYGKTGFVNTYVPK
jgi:hypothetical protein